jgi:hypothetical protein
VRVTDKLSHDGRPRQALLLPVAGSVLALGMGIFLAVSLESVLWLILAVASVIANAGTRLIDGPNPPSARGVGAHAATRTETCLTLRSARSALQVRR